MFIIEIDTRVEVPRIVGMADLDDKHPQGVPGPFFTDLSCIDCGLCHEDVPEVFKLDEERRSYVWQQPRTEEEGERAREAMEGCPVEAIEFAEC